MRSTKEIAWAAGLVEGEGCLSWNGRSPSLHVSSTDRDVLERFALLTRVRVRGPIAKANAKKPQFQASVGGPMAAAWMMTLYPMLGARRKAKAREVIAAWKSRPVAHKQTFWIKNGGAVRAAGGMF